MLPRVNRLKKSKDFERVFKKSRPTFTANFSIRSAKVNSKNTRVGFIISNKINKLATRRNSLKRQLRKSTYDLISKFKPGYDVIVIVKQDFRFPYNHKEIEAQIAEGYKKAGIVK